jgi:hypothetical protein
MEETFSRSSEPHLQDRKDQEELSNHRIPHLLVANLDIFRGDTERQAEGFQL